jgi:hypothetical protein
MAINSTDFTAEQLYKQQELLKQENYVLQNHQRPFVPMGTPLEYQGKGVPTMAPSRGKSMADWTTEEARNYALKWGAASLLGLTGIGAGIGYAGTGALGRQVMMPVAKEVIGELPEYVKFLKAAGGGGAGARAAQEIGKNARNIAEEAKRLSEIQYIDKMKNLMGSKPGFEGLKSYSKQVGIKLEPLVNRYKDIYEYTMAKTQNKDEAIKNAFRIIRKEFETKNPY